MEEGIAPGVTQRFCLNLVTLAPLPRCLQSVWFARRVAYIQASPVG